MHMYHSLHRYLMLMWLFPFWMLPLCNIGRVVFAMDDTAAPTDAVQLASSMDKACFSIVYRFYSFAHECVETDGAKHNSRLLQVLPGTPQHEAFETPQCPLLFGGRIG